ncbi:MAG: UDP-N-acetylglucosamine 2-epimerase (non-hydrolyzing) [Firmicutes bacterium]|jgi:UDP-N-acetylglucosamine 2-epimerase (non-hydrolysing)|nr:UDP-N-acetylglucosamine 2-epimerase (non-hydrolyzing) [Bacillota bacterium]MCL5014511.1 UDP-N-acetylglucosamine 2-epimerase (non-hydrolyzing) [Bacillota bacterium]
MKILTILGTRPEIIRLSRIIPQIDGYATQFLVFTGQNFEPHLGSGFFDELKIRTPDEFWSVHALKAYEQIAAMYHRMGETLERVKPDRVLVLGDTNSGLSAVIAARFHIPVYHLEAGNRCFDDRVPEEINRRVIDHVSRVLLPYTHRSQENLLREGIERQRTIVVGNPIYEVMQHYHALIVGSSALSRFSLIPGQYFLATLHRAETVDNPSRLVRVVSALFQVVDQWKLPLVISLHPRTRQRLEEFGLSLEREGIVVTEPLGFGDFVRLEQDARMVLTDSGTVQEECAIMGIANVTLRHTTERPETIECGSNILAGTRAETILRAVEMALSPARASWSPPAEYLVSDVSSIVTGVVLGESL